MIDDMKKTGYKGGKVIISHALNELGAIKLKENRGKYILIENFLKDLSKKDIIDIMVDAKIIYDKDNINEILDYLIVCLFNLAKEKREYLECIKHVNECSTRLKANANFDMSMDRLVFKMWEEVK